MSRLDKEELAKILGNLTVREKEVFRIANNVLYFEDNSDYGTALWEILALLAARDFDDADDLDYIE